MSENQKKVENKDNNKSNSFFSYLGLSTSVATIVTASAAGLTKAGLYLYGFSSLGPVAGSAAAGLQASIGSVSAGSTFAFFQGAAMSGITPLLVPAAAIGVPVGGFIWWSKYRDDKKKNQGIPWNLPEDMEQIMLNKLQKNKSQQKME